jgi:hypothetical protein
MDLLGVYGALPVICKNAHYIRATPERESNVEKQYTRYRFNVPFTHDPPDENTADIHRDHVIID